jgi:hypothetical protein
LNFNAKALFSASFGNRTKPRTLLFKLRPVHSGCGSRFPERRRIVIGERFDANRNERIVANEWVWWPIKGA